MHGFTVKNKKNKQSSNKKRKKEKRKKENAINETDNIFFQELIYIQV